jgi:hypothetical protein
MIMSPNNAGNILNSDRNFRFYLFFAAAFAALGAFARAEPSH